MESLAIPSSGPTVLSVTRPSREDEDVPHSNSVLPRRDIRFFLIFTSMCISLSLSGLELSSLSTALPTIANDLHDFQYTWVSSAYTLTSTGFLPMSGGLAQAFGRRPAILITIGVFALGNGICGAANSMNMLIAGRAIQGFGGGAIQSLTGIVLADLVTLRERGIYVGLYALTWCISISIGPVIGGTLATQGQWRWLFYLNLLLSLAAWVSIVSLLDLPTPTGSYQEKFMQMDWIGNFLMISSTVAYTIGLTWGGTTAPWGSATVLVPLILGLVGLGIFIAYEVTLAKYPLVPFSLMTNMTSISGYIQTVSSWLIISTVTYEFDVRNSHYLHSVELFADHFPVYFMACKGTSSMVAGIYSLGFVPLVPAAIITGCSVKASGRYRPQTWIGWSLIIIALGLMSAILATDSLVKSVGYFALLGWGAGMLTGTTLYPIQAPLPVTLNAQSLSFMWFLRSFASVLGVTLGGAVLQDELSKRLPASFIQSASQRTSIIYALIPNPSTLPRQKLSEVEIAYADSLASLWRVLAIISAAGFVSSFFMKGLSLHNTLDAEWALRDAKEVQQETNASVAQAQDNEVLCGESGGCRNL